jgi:hypothetical protein
MIKYGSHPEQQRWFQANGGGEIMTLNGEYMFVKIIRRIRRSRPRVLFVGSILLPSSWMEGRNKTRSGPPFMGLVRELPETNGGCARSTLSGHPTQLKRVLSSGHYPTGCDSKFQTNLNDGDQWPPPRRAITGARCIINVQ